jgi:adenosylcobinamide-phosphate synthase
MVGYMDEKHRDLGFFSAKTDDVLNWIPARICVVYITIGSLLAGIISKGKKLDHGGAIKCATSDCRSCSSPNSGYPMASVAGVLGVRLEKPNTYVIGKDFSLPVADDIKQASVVIAAASVLAVFSFAVLIYIISAIINYI